MLPKHLGGLGLINIAMQAKALCLQVLLWTFKLAFYPLQCFLRHEADRSPQAWFSYNSLAGLLDIKHDVITNQSLEVVTNMLGSWDFF